MNLLFSALVLLRGIVRRALVQRRETLDNTNELLGAHKSLYERHANPIRSKPGTLRMKDIVPVFVQLGTSVGSQCGTVYTFFGGRHRGFRGHSMGSNEK